MIDAFSFMLGVLVALCLPAAIGALVMAYRVSSFVLAVVLAGLSIRRMWVWIGGLLGIWSAESVTMGSFRFAGSVVWRGGALPPIKLRRDHGDTKGDARGRVRSARLGMVVATMEAEVARRSGVTTQDRAAGVKV